MDKEELTVERIRGKLYFYISFNNKKIKKYRYDIPKKKISYLDGDWWYESVLDAKEIEALLNGKEVIRSQTVHKLVRYANKDEWYD